MIPRVTTPPKEYAEVFVNMVGASTTGISRNLNKVTVCTEPRAVIMAVAGKAARFSPSIHKRKKEEKEG